MNMQVLDAAAMPAAVTEWMSVAATRRSGVLEWFSPSRPMSRYLSLNELAHTVRDRADRSRTRVSKARSSMWKQTAPTPSAWP